MAALCEVSAGGNGTARPGPCGAAAAGPGHAAERGAAVAALGPLCPGRQGCDCPEEWKGKAGLVPCLVLCAGARRPRWRWEAVLGSGGFSAAVGWHRAGGAGDRGARGG